LRIAIATELFYPSLAGCEKRFFEIGRRLVRRGHEVHVLTTQHEAGLPKNDVVEGMLVQRYAYSKKYVTKKSYRSMSGVLKYSLATLFKLLSKNDFDIYYFNQWPIAHSMFAKPFFSPFIQEWCEVWFDKIVVLEKILSKSTSHHVAVSHFTKARLMDFLHVPSNKITVIPNGVEYNKFCEKSHKKKWGKIVYVGRLIPHKHVEMLIEAFREVKKKLPEAELHVIGSGSLLPSIKIQASKIDACFIHGFLPEDRMVDILKTSWLFVSLSEREGSGISSLEASAAGIPVITTSYPDNAVKEMINHVKSGIVVHPNVSDIVSAILKVYSDEESWKEMSNNAQLFAMKNDWDLVASQMEAYFCKIRSEYDPAKGNYS
jgi:glycosyltransferase involved in cell wall biosynthesis